MSTAINWAAMGVHAAGAAGTAVLLRPSPGHFEQDLAWGSTTFGFLANTVRFLAEALKFGRWPQAPASYATNWVRYVGAGLGTAGFMASLAALSRGGVSHFIFTLFGVLAYYTVLTFAALAFETNAAVIGFFTIAAVLFVVTAAAYYRLNAAHKTYTMWVPVMSWMLEVGFITMAGIEVFNRNVASNYTEDIVFAVLSVVKGLWALVVYLGGVEGTWLQQLAYGQQDNAVAYSATYTNVQTGY